MNYQTLKDELYAGKYRPVYLFHGDDQFTIDEVGSFIVKRILDENTEEMTLLYADEPNISDIFDSLRQVTMFSDKRVVLVRRMDKFPKPAEKKTDDNGKSIGVQLLNYCQKPDEDVCLIMCASERLDTKSGFWAKLDKACDGAIFWPRKDMELEMWIKKQFSKYKKTCAVDVVSWLAVNSEGDLYKLTNEIDKLVCYVGQRTNVTLKDALDICCFDQNNTSYDLFRHIADKDSRKALRTLYGIQDLERDAIMLLNSLQRFYSTVYYAKLELKQGTNEKSLASKIGIPQFFIKDYVYGAKKISYVDLQKGFYHLLNIDFQLKNGYPPRIALSQLVHRLCG